MNTFNNLFTQSKNDKLVVMDMDYLDLSSVKDQPLFASSIILLKTDKNTYVLTCSEGNGQINVDMGGWVTPKIRDKSCKEMILSLLNTKMGLPKKIKEQYPGLQSYKIYKTFLKQIWKSDLENKVCFNESSDHSRLTTVVSIPCTEINLDKTINAFNKLVELKKGNTIYKVEPLETILTYSLQDKAAQANNGIEICNVATIRALDINQVFRPWKKKPFIVDYPVDIHMAIFRYLDDKDKLSFLLISPYFISMLDEKNEIWKLLVSPMLPLEARKYLKDEDYKRIFIKKVFPDLSAIKSDFSKINKWDLAFGAVHCLILPPLILFAMPGISDHFLNNMTIHKKKANIDKIKKLINEDNDVELIYEVSRLGELLPYILMNNVNRNEIDEKIDMLNVFHSSTWRLSFEDIQSIAILMPYLLSNQAEKCFELFIKIYLFGLKHFQDISVLEEFTALIKPVLDSDYPHFKFKLIQLILNDGDLVFTKLLSNLCIDMNMQELLLEASSNTAFASDLQLICPQDNDKKLSELKNLLNEITNQIINNDLTPDELRIHFEGIQKIMPQMIKVKQNLGQYSSAQEDSEDRASNSFKL